MTDWGLVRLRAGVASASQAQGLLLWLAATIAVAAAVGAMVGRGEVKLAALPVVALVGVVIASVPEAGYVAILWSVGTAVDLLALPEVGAASFRFTPAEVLLWIAMACLALLPRDVRKVLAALVTRRESLLMMVFLAAVLAAVAVGVENGATLHQAAFDARYMLFYAAFWPALAGLSRGRGRPLTLVCAGVIVVVALQILQVIAGPSTHLFAIAHTDVSGTLTSDKTGFLRVRPPGLTTIYLVSGFALARVLWGPARGRMLGWGLTAVTLTGVILSLNRNMLVGLALGLAVAALIAPQRHRVVVLAATLALVFAGVILVAQTSKSLSASTVVSRVASVANYSELKTQTLNDRFYENTMALRRIRAHPIGGLGWGPDYGAVLTTSDDGFMVSQPRSFMHEQYLWIWMRAGLVGLFALIAMIVLGIWNGARWCRARHGHDDAWLGAGIVVSLVAVAASSNVAIYLTPPDSIVPLVGVLALGAMLRRELSRS